MYFTGRQGHGGQGLSGGTGNERADDMGDSLAGSRGAGRKACFIGTKGGKGIYRADIRRWPAWGRYGPPSGRVGRAGDKGKLFSYGTEYTGAGGTGAQNEG